MPETVDQFSCNSFLTFTSKYIPSIIDIFHMIFRAW